VVAVQTGELITRRRGSTGRRLGGYLRRSRTAQLEAEFLDRLVDAELEFIRRLPVHLRSKPAEALAVLVMLAQSHRHYAQGWISRRELRGRAESSITALDVLRDEPAPEQLA
jgi:hypothetical protein